MPTVKLTDARWLSLQVARVKGVLEARLPRAGLPAADVRAFLNDLGLQYTDADIAAIRAALVADATIEILP